MQYGADYNPEQWSEETWLDDIERMREAHVTMVSLGIFAWSRIQPSEGEFDFEWLDKIIDLLHDAGISVDLATATASPPPWASARYPEILPADAAGVLYWPGSRQHFAPSSPVYRRLASELVTALAERYAQHPAVVMWHVNNEYGCHLNADYSDAARDAFRGWLERRYGSVDALNAAWGTTFWSQRYQAFAEVFPPRQAPYSHNPGQLLDFHRFTSDMLLECYLMERDIIRSAGAAQPITTNFMGAFKPANYAQWAVHLDVVSDDCYPDPNDPESFRASAFQRDLVRSLKPDVPWILMEQSTNAVNWRRSNAPKAPGQMAALSAQAIARGAEGILFFQWRQSAAGAEKFHSAMLPHAGTNTRTWREVTALGAQLASLPDLPAGQTKAEVALVFDWENWWAIENPDHPVVLDYLALVQRWYRALHRRHVSVDIVPPERLSSQYVLAIAPNLYLLRTSGADAMNAFAESGGHLLVGPFSDVVDECDRFRPGGFLTQLRSTLGVSVEDFGALAITGTGPGQDETKMSGAFGTVRGTLLSEEIDARDANVDARFRGGRSEGQPALTSRVVGGGGVARYLATIPDEAGTQTLVDYVLAEAGIHPAVPGLPDTVEIVARGDVLGLVNHGSETVRVPVAGRELLSDELMDSVRLDPYDWAFIRQS